MRLVVQKEISNDEDLREAWRTLLQKVDQPQVFYTYEWAASVARAFNGSNPLLITAWDESEMVGVVALDADYSKGQIAFLAGTTADYCDFICVEKYRKEFIGKVLDHIESTGLKTLVLANVPADSPTAKLLRQVSRSRGFAVLVRPAYQCSQLRFNSPAERAVLKNAGSRKEAVRRHLKALSKFGPVEIEHLSDKTEIEQELRDFSQMHVSRFLTTGRISNLANPERRSFLRELTQQLSADRAVVLSRLSVLGRAIAWNFGFRFGNSWFWYQPTFDTEFQQHSPGVCLLAKIIEDASQNPDLQLVDLGLGAEDYKERWSNQVRETLHLTASRSSVIHCRETLRYHVTRTIRRKPDIDRAVRTAVSAITRIKKKHKNLPAVAQGARKRIASWLMGEPEVLFFENSASRPDPGAKIRVHPITMKWLGQAVTEYANDPETLSYLLRSAARLRSHKSEGFVAVDEVGVPVHFCWVTPFEDFYLEELKRTLSAPSPDSKLIFDCWTPVSVRGKGFYPATIAKVAGDLAPQTRVWIFASAISGASLQGIRKAGFIERFSVALRRSGLQRRAVYSDLAPGAMMRASSAA